MNKADMVQDQELLELVEDGNTRAINLSMISQGMIHQLFVDQLLRLWKIQEMMVQNQSWNYASS